MKTFIYIYYFLYRKEDKKGVAEMKNTKGISSKKLRGDKLVRAIKEAQKDPDFIEEVKRFIKITTGA